KIRDKNIVEAYGYFEDNNTLYSVMEFIDGIDLDKYLKKVPPFTEDEAKDLLLQISSGIEKIHAINVLHRDIKPSNIMKTRDGVYKLIDFTTNRTYEDNKLTTVTSFRSPIYTPPELSGNKKAIIGKFTDIYSIGMTICRVLAEDEETLPNITDRLINDSEFQLLIDSFDIDDNFKNILRKMTQVNAEDRFKDLEEIEKLLNQTTQISEPNQSTEIDELPKKSKKEDTKSKSWLNIIALVLSIILLGLGGYAYKIIKDNKENNKIIQQKPDIEITTTNNQEEDIKPEIKPLSIPEITPHEEMIEEQEIQYNEIENNPEEIQENNNIEIIATPKPEITQEPISIPTPTATQEPTPTPTRTQKPTPTSTPTKQPTPTHHKTISLGTMIQAGNLPPLPHDEPTNIWNRTDIQKFLLSFMKSSEGNSITNLLSYYNYHIDRYFSWKNITHRDIYRDKL
ncbi:MAG: protein kinase, partial [Sulfurovaceae bacterium]|nr:protein kinase [Sulfurovaceae bacterium]